MAKPGTKIEATRSNARQGNARVVGYHGKQGKTGKGHGGMNGSNAKPCRVVKVGGGSCA